MIIEINKALTNPPVDRTRTNFHILSLENVVEADLTTDGALSILVEVARKTAWRSRHKTDLITALVRHTRGIAMDILVDENNRITTSGNSTRRIGWVFMTEEDIKSYLKVSKITKTGLSRAYSAMEQRVKVLDEQLKGEYYTMTIDGQETPTKYYTSVKSALEAAHDFIL